MSIIDRPNDRMRSQRSDNRFRKFRLPSLLIIVSGFIGPIKYFINPGFISSTEDILIAVFNICLSLTIGLLIYKKYMWPKYVVLALAVFGLLNFPTLRPQPSASLTIISLIPVLQRLLLISATILLFIPSKTDNRIGN